MKQACSHYFLSSTALHIWEMHDRNGENQMLACLIAEKKSPWFDRVIFKSGTVPEWQLQELAEDAFVATCEWFIRNGRAGTIHIEKTEYTGLLFTIFKRLYIKLIEKQIVLEAKEKYGIEQAAGGHTAEDRPATGAVFSPETQTVLNKLSAPCKELMQWRYEEAISYDEIAIRKGISREYCIKMMFRCKQYFLKQWKIIKAGR